MTLGKTIARVLTLLLVCGHVAAQNYLEFIENKGQWDRAIRFKGDISNGSFALQSNGYRVLLHKQEDLAALAEQLHGHGSSAGTNNNPATGAGNNTPVQVKRNKVTETEKIEVPWEGGGSGGNKPVVVRSHAYQVRFLNANENPEIIPEKPLPGNINYISGNDSAKWTAGCTSYQALTYKNIYPNIDLRYYTAGGVLKYDLIINPGADISKVALYYEGVDGLRVKDGKLVVKTSVEDVQEFPPYSYQLLNNQRMEVPCSYEVKGNIVRFKIDGAYAKTATLVVDPSFVFSTFSGSSADNWGYTATYDGQGNFYAGGIVFGGNGRFPANNGAFQTSFQGGGNTGEGSGFDIGIIKFDPLGTTRVYATYIGGDGNEQPHSLFADPSGNLVIAGRTTSTNYPLKGALQKYGPLGTSIQWDIILTKLNRDGTDLIGSVRIGGAGDDGVNIKPKYSGARAAQSIDRNYGDDARSEVIMDGAGNIYLASCTQSKDFPTTPGAFQSISGGTNASGRDQDGVLLKFAPNLSAILFSTRFGGSDDDAAFVLALNPLNNDIYVAGATASNNLPGNKAGTITPSFQGGICDGFIAQFTNNGTYIRSTYLGTGGDDLVYGVQFDKFGFPYVMGTTTGKWVTRQPAGTATFFVQQNGKQFISKLKPDLSDYVYSTVFGTPKATPNLSPVAFLVDRCENVYLSGWGGGIDASNGSYPNSFTFGLPIAGGGDPLTDGDDFYFFVLERDAKSQLYGSFFGQKGGNTGEHVDGGTSRFDRNGVIYQAICANCGGGAQFPTTAGVWSPTNGSKQCNLAAIKIAFNLAGVGAGIRASINGVLRDTTGCVPLTADFSDTLAMGKKYVWDFGDGTPPQTTAGATNSHTFNAVGNYRVSLTSIDSSSCNIADTSYVIMRVRNDEVKMSFTARKLPPCTSLNYEFNNTSIAPPGKPLNNQSFLWLFGDNTTQVAGGGPVVHAYQAGGTYTVQLVLVDTNYCNYDDTLSMQIRIASNVKAQFETPAVGCVPYTAVFNNTSMGGQQFAWDFGDGTTSTQTSPTHLYNNIGTYTVKLVAIDSSTCNIIDSTSFTISVNPNPTAGYNYTPQPTLPNTPINFQNTSAGGTKYKWLFGDGDTLVTIQRDTTVQHLYNYSGKFNACVVAYNNAGCSDTACQMIAVTIIPGMDIPNAFTPNGDGTNDKIYVKGYGIAKMVWRIYNRWGVLVYVGTDKSEGWDGRYKGVLQPQDVYHYTALIEFSDGTKATKKGDITLLR